MFTNETFKAANLYTYPSQKKKNNNNNNNNNNMFFQNKVL